MPGPPNSGPALHARARASQQSSEMSDTLKPPHLQGKAFEDAATWLDQLECYLIFKKVDEAQKAPEFSLLLDGSVRTWYESLSTATKRDYGALVDAFVCEEKHTFAPDAFKSGTLVQKHKDNKMLVAHRKRGKDIISVVQKD